MLMHKKILRLAIPNIISNITIPLLGLVDIAILGHLSNEKYLGAVSVGVIIFNILFMSLGFFRMGISGTIAQAYGARNFKSINENSRRGVAIAGIIGILLIIIQYPIGKIGFHFIHASDETKQLALIYFKIRIYSAPAVLINYIISGWFTGMQNTRLTMIHSLFINISNILLNLFFVISLNWNIKGVAFGSVLAQYLGMGFGLLLYFMVYHFRIRRFASCGKIFTWIEISKFFKVNGDLFIRTACLLVAFTLFTSKSAAINDTMLAMNTILLQFLYLFSNLSDGFAIAAEAIVGKLYGAKDFKNLKLAINKLFQWGLGLAFTYSLVYLFLYDFIVRLLTNSSSIINLSHDYKYWIVIVPFTAFAAFLWDGIFVGILASRQMRNAMIISVGLVFLPCYFMFNNISNTHWLWLSMLLFMAARSISMTYFYNKYLKTC